MDCPVCHTSVAPPARYCSHCGTRLTVAENGVSERQSESDNRFRNYVEHAPHGMFIADEQGRYIEVNRAACRITGYEEAELLRMSIADTLPADYLNLGLAHFSQVRESGKAQAELPFIGKGGRYGWWLVEAVKLSETRFMGFVTDIAERRQAENALQHERDLLRQILDSYFGFVCVLTPDGLILEANQTPLKLLGMSREAVRGRRLWEVGWAEPGPAMQVQAAVESAARGETVRAEIVTNFPGHAPLRVDTVFHPLRDQAGKVINVVAFGVDITERDHVERGLRLFRALVDQTTDVIEVIDFETGRFLDVNERACIAHGYTREEYLRLRVPDIDPVVAGKPWGELMQERRLAEF